MCLLGVMLCITVTMMLYPPPLSKVFGESDDDDMASSTHSGDQDKTLPRDDEQDGENNLTICVS